MMGKYSGLKEVENMREGQRRLGDEGNRGWIVKEDRGKRACTLVNLRDEI